MHQVRTIVSWSSEQRSDSMGEGGLTLKRTETPLPRSIAVSDKEKGVPSSEFKGLVAPMRRVEISGTATG